MFDIYVRKVVKRAHWPSRKSNVIVIDIYIFLFMFWPELLLCHSNLTIDLPQWLMDFCLCVNICIMKITTCHLSIEKRKCWTCVYVCPVVAQLVLCTQMDLVELLLHGNSSLTWHCLFFYHQLLHKAKCVCVRLCMLLSWEIGVTSLCNGSGGQLQSAVCLMKINVHSDLSVFVKWFKPWLAINHVWSVSPAYRGHAAIINTP